MCCHQPTAASVITWRKTERYCLYFGMSAITIFAERNLTFSDWKFKQPHGRHNEKISIITILNFWKTFWRCGSFHWPQLLCLAISDPSLLRIGKNWVIIAEGATFSQWDQQKNEFGYAETLSGNSNMTIMLHWLLENKFIFHTQRLEALRKPFHIVRHLEKHWLFPLKAVLLSEIFLGKWYWWDWLLEN